MSNPIDSGGTAFPRHQISETPHGPMFVMLDGMTLRDYFAAAALEGMSPPKEYRPAGPGIAQMAQRAYLYADAMLEARKGEKP